MWDQYHTGPNAQRTTRNQRKRESTHKKISYERGEMKGESRHKGREGKGLLLREVTFLLSIA